MLLQAAFPLPAQTCGVSYTNPAKQLSTRLAEQEWAKERSKRGRWVVTGVIPETAHVVVERVCLVTRSSWTHNSCLNSGLCVWWAKCNFPRRWFSRLLEWQLVLPRLFPRSSGSLDTLLCHLGEQRKEVGTQSLHLPG